MSERDKKLLVYLGALIILAAAYFFVGRPFLDKIDKLSTEKMQLEQQLAEKRKALENKAMYEEGITDTNAKMQEIIDKFPADNSDEKSIMFASHAEADIPIWFSHMTFAEETQTLVNGDEVQSASDVEQQQLEENVAAAEGEEVAVDSDMATEEMASGRGDSSVGDLVGRDTELGLTFQVEYENFKKYLAYIRDYEDRLVIKDIDVSYSAMTDLVSGTMVLSQYAILGDDRVLPDVVTDVEEKGTDNIFTNKDKGGSIIDLVADIASEFISKLMGGLGEEITDTLGTDYFVKANAVTDNTSGITIGKADDAKGKSYITSDKNDNQQITLSVEGDSGEYTVKYSIDDNVYEDKISKGSDEKLYFRIISTERSGDDDKVSLSVHVINKSDIEVVVNIEGDGSDNPRVVITEKVGEVSVND